VYGNHHACPAYVFEYRCPSLHAANPWRGDGAQCGPMLQTVGLWCTLASRQPPSSWISKPQGSLGRFAAWNDRRGVPRVQQVLQAVMMAYPGQASSLQGTHGPFTPTGLSPSSSAPAAGSAKSRSKPRPRSKSRARTKSPAARWVVKGSAASNPASRPQSPQRGNSDH
jgi:hypothetical protein